MTMRGASTGLAKTFASGTDAVPVWEVVRAGVTVPVVLGVTLIGWGAGDAIYAGLGALLVILGERSGTTGQRLWKAGAGLVAGLLAMALGPMTAGSGLLPLVVVGAFAALSGVMVAYGPALSFAGMQLLVQMAIAGGLQVDVPVSTRLVAYALGGVVALAGTAALSATEHTEQLYDQKLIRVLRDARAWRQKGLSSREERWRIDGALAQADDMVRTMRAWSRKRRALREQLQATRDRVSLEVTAIWSGDSRPLPGTPASSSSRGGTISVAQLSLAPWRTTAARSFVGRLVACMLVAEAARQIVPVGHSYWILLTVALALKPDLASVYSRSLQRGWGTLLGVGLAFVVTRIPAGIGSFVCMGLLCAAVPWTVRRNYAWFSVVITPIVILFLDLLAPTGLNVLAQRVIQTVLGCLIVLVIGYLCWPDTWRPTARPAIARLCGALAGLIEARAGSREIPTTEEADERLSIARSLSALRGRAISADGEPGPLRRKAAHWKDVVNALDDVLMTVLQAPRRPAPDATAALRLMADALLEPDRQAIHRLTPTPSADPLQYAVNRLGLSLGSLRTFGS